MKVKGFTLIELLAVIVILAIIALIATPIILNIIGNSKKSAVLRGGELYLSAVETAIARENLNSQFNPTTCIIRVDGSLICDEEKILTVEVSGSKPTSGTIELTNSKITTVTGMILDGNELEKEKNEKLKIVGTSTIEPILPPISKVNSSNIKTYIDGNTHEMYTFEHESTEQTDALTDYRYIGNDPYNYVTFNEETWRIIGIFTVEDENGNKSQRMKIVRNESIGAHIWHATQKNDWENANLSIYLNEDYYNTLKDEAKEMIGSTKYYLGGVNTNSAQEYYKSERGIEAYSHAYSTSWIGKIGLMYPSDYLYTYANGVDDVCYNNGWNCYTAIPTSGWIYNPNYEDEQCDWLISPSSNSDTASYIYSMGLISNNANVAFEHEVRPTLYLSSNVEIIGGTGEQGNPYKIKLSQ